jgi:hypothetical protein
MLKNIEVPKKDFEEGQTIKGYLLTKSISEMKNDSGEMNQRPMLVLQDKETGEAFKIFLGKTALDTLSLLVEGYFTIVKKEKKIKLKGGRGYFPYSIQQDDEDTLNGEH